MSSAFQLILLPGLGADERLLAPQREAFPQLIVPRWIPPRRTESLPEYAERMCGAVAPPRGVPLILGGVSFGGMLAYEMARHWKPDAVVLIASCRERRGLRPLYRAARPFWPFVPVTVWSVAKLFSRPVMNIKSRLPPADRDVMIRMFQEMDSRFMHWVVRAILNWRPEPLDGIPIFHVHGRRDRVLPARGVAADHWIDGGHIINVSHAGEVNSFIANVERNLFRSPPSE